MSGEWVGIVFWLVILGIVGLRIWGRAQAERERQQTIRAAIERGQQLDPALLEKIMASNVSRSDRSPEHLVTGGIVTAAVGLGLGLLGVFLGHSDEDALWPVVGAGGLVLLIGLGTVMAGVIKRRMRRDDQTGQLPPPDSGM
jgi:hypothetical protein